MSPVNRFRESELAFENLWAPWRLQYVVVDKDSDTGCFLCHGWQHQADRENLVVHRRARSLVMLNRYPYNNGHLLVAPAGHKSTMQQLTDEEMLELMRTIGQMMRALDEVLRPDGYNVGLNLGRVAGAGLPGHVHWHIVPRWNGDTNFMPVVSDTRVIVQSLEELYDRLTEQLEQS